MRTVIIIIVVILVIFFSVVFLEFFSNKCQASTKYDKKICGIKFAIEMEKEINKNK
jgi:hypothetical protein